MTVCHCGDYASLLLLGVESSTSRSLTISGKRGRGA